MLLEQCAAGAVHDQRLQRGCEKVCCPALSVILYLSYMKFRMHLLITHVYFLCRYSEKNPNTDFLDHHLKVLFDNLHKDTTYTYKITKKMGINNGTEQQNFFNTVNS